jgi:hypothetical protein
MAVKTKEEDMMDIMAEEIQKEIDAEIMSNILVESGWTPVKFHYKSNEHANDVTFWLMETCNGKWHRYGSAYLFKDKQDAEWFILRWT